MYINLNENLNPELDLDLDVDFMATGDESDIARVVFESTIELEAIQEASMRMSGQCFTAMLKENYEKLDLLTEAEAPKFFDRIKTMFENALKKMMAVLKSAFDTIQKFLISDKSFVEKYSKLVSEKAGSGTVKINGHNFGDIDGIDIKSLESKLNGTIYSTGLSMGDSKSYGKSVSAVAATVPKLKDDLASEIVAGATVSTLREKLADKYIGKAGEVSLNIGTQLKVVETTKDQLKTISEIRDTIKKSYETTLNDISKMRSEMSKVKAEKYTPADGEEPDASKEAAFKKGQIAASSQREGSLAFLSLAAEVTNVAKNLINTTAGFQIAALKSRRSQAKTAVVKYIHGTGAKAESTNESAISSFIWGQI